MEGNGVQSVDPEGKGPGSATTCTNNDPSARSTASQRSLQGTVIQEAYALVHQESLAFYIEFFHDH